jgi:hypothetical protein
MQALTGPDPISVSIRWFTHVQLSCNSFNRGTPTASLEPVPPALIQTQSSAALILAVKLIKFTANQPPFHQN